jgi:hypothetical protein
VNLQESLGVPFMEGISYSLLRIGNRTSWSNQGSAYSCRHELDTSLDRNYLRRLLLSNLELIMTVVDSVRICA